MSEMILGLDIGIDAVKAVLAAPKGRADVRIAAQQVLRYEGIGDLEAVLKKLAETIRPQNASAMRCAVSLPPSEFMFRQVSLPFRDETRIKKTLPFELEPLLPLPIEEVVVDYLPLAAPEDGLLAAVCGRERIRKIIAAVEAHLGEVEVIDISAAALALPLLEGKTAAEGGVLLDVGASSTVALFYERNAIVQIRSFAFGGQAITQALAEDASCSPEEAEKMKRDGAYGANLGRAEEACRQFCTTLANTTEFLKLNGLLHQPVTQLTLTGGGALFAPLAQQLEKTFGIRPELLDIGRFGHSPAEERLRGDIPPQEMNTALATARRMLSARRSFNFRQGEFAPKNILAHFRTQLRWAAGVACVIAVLAAVDAGLGYYLQSREATAVKNSISQIFRKYFPPTASMVDPVAQLKSRLAEERKMYGMDSGATGAPVVELFKEISLLIPASVDVVMTHFHYENNVILLKGEAKKVDDITTVKNSLAKSSYFKNVTVGTTALGKEGAKVDFDIKVELK